MATTTGNPNLNKRKRGTADQDVGRNVKPQSTNGEHETYAALLQGLEGLPGADDSTRTAQAALAAPMNQSAYPEPNSFDGGAMNATFDGNSPTGLSGMGTAQAVLEARGGNQNKLPVGSTEWHQQRKDNHKEGEKHPFRWGKCMLM